MGPAGSGPERRAVRRVAGMGAAPSPPRAASGGGGSGGFLPVGHRPGRGARWAPRCRRCLAALVPVPTEGRLSDLGQRQCWGGRPAHRRQEAAGPRGTPAAGAGRLGLGALPARGGPASSRPRAAVAFGLGGARFCSRWPVFRGAECRGGCLRAGVYPAGGFPSEGLGGSKRCRFWSEARRPSPAVWGWRCGGGGGGARAKRGLGCGEGEKSLIRVGKDEAEVSRKGAIIKRNSAVSSMQQTCVSFLEQSYAT